MWYVIVVTNPLSLYLICKRNVQGQSIYKSDTNRMDMFQLLCFMVCEQIKGTLSLCMAWRTILYCWSCAVEWCEWFSWWKGLSFLAIKLNGFTMPTCVTFLVFRLSVNVRLMLLINWLLSLYEQRALCIVAYHTCMALQQSSARPSWSIILLFWGLAGGN